MYWISSDGKKYDSFKDWAKKNQAEYDQLEKINFSYQDWLEGTLTWSSWNFGYGDAPITYQPENVLKIHYLPKEEYQKIIDKQQEILDSHIQINFDWYRERFKAKHLKSMEKRVFIQDELKQYNRLLTDKGCSNFLITYAGGKKHTYNGAIHSRGQSNYTNEIAYWYYKIIVRADVEARSFINPSHENNFNQYIPQIATLVFYKYKKYLEDLLLKNHSKDLPFEKLFRGNYYAKVIAYMKHKQMISGNTTENYRWIDDYENGFIGFFWAIRLFQFDDNRGILKSPLISVSQYQRILFKAYKIQKWSKEKFIKRTRHNYEIQSEIVDYLKEFNNYFRKI